MKQRAIAIAGFWVVVLFTLALRAPNFFEPNNLRDVALVNAPALIVAVGMTLIILSGEIDVSVGSQFAVATVVAGLAAQKGLPLAAIILVTTLAGAMLGALNGLIVVGLRVPSIVATLAAMAFWREILRWTTGGAWIEGLPSNFQWMGMSQTSGELVIFGATIAIAAFFAWAMRHLRAGRAVYAIGSAKEAARLAGIPVNLASFCIFVMMGALTGLAAFLNAMRFSEVQPNAGAGLELKAISAVVIGGAAISGGRGTLWGTVLGAGVLAVIAPALTFLGINAFWEKAIQGGIILGAIVLERAATKRRAALV